MAAPFYSRKRRSHAGPSKNELKASRNESDRKTRVSAGTLRGRFPQVVTLQVEMRMESTAGAVLQQMDRSIGLDEPLQLDVACLGGCANGVFLLTQAIETALSSGQESREGMGLCESASYADPARPCGTKLLYRLDITRSA